MADVIKTEEGTIYGIVLGFFAARIEMEKGNKVHVKIGDKVKFRFISYEKENNLLALIKGENPEIIWSSSRKKRTIENEDDDDAKKIKKDNSVSEQKKTCNNDKS